MQYNEPVTQLIAARHSVRSFKPGGMTPEQVRLLREYLAGVDGLGESRVRLRLVDRGETTDTSRVGTYGVIRGADHFIVAVIPGDEPAALTQLGYRLEKAALYAVSLGLGTCWLGGTFTHGAFAKLVDLQPESRLPVVMPVGAPAERPRLRDVLMRSLPGSGRRKEWFELFFDGDASHALSKGRAGAFAQPLEMVRLAPSAMNAQPWRVIREGEHFHFFGYSANGPLADVHRIDLGIAMCHFDLTAQEAGLSGGFTLAKPETLYNPPHLTFVASWVPETAAEPSI